MKALWTLLVILMAAAPCPSQTYVQKDDSAPPPPPPAPRETRLSARPAGEPVPALKYRLLPTLTERAPGDAAQAYYQILNGLELDANSRKTLNDWLDLPVEKLPADQAWAFLGEREYWLRQLHRAARREGCRWEFPLREEGIGLLLPELGKFRDLGRLLSLKARLEIAGGNYEDAVLTLQTGLGLARDVGKGPFLISALVGNAIAGALLQQAEQIIQAPGSPNLYWALSALGQPMVDIRPATEYEMGWVEFQWPFLAGVARGERISPRQWDKVVRDAGAAGAGGTLWGGTGPPGPAGVAPAAQAVMAIHYYAKGKEFLIAQGRSREEVEKLPVAEVVSVYAVQSYQRLRDDLFKWFHVPYWQAHAGFRQANRSVQQAHENMEAWPFTLLLPSLGRAYFATVKLDRHVAALRCVEAIRMHAAAHDGKPPARLEDITVVPIPLNPVTGKPFGYTVDGQTVTLDAPALEGMNVQDGDRYVLTLTK